VHEFQYPMNLDELICPVCNNDKLAEKEKHNTINFLFGGTMGASPFATGISAEYDPLFIFCAGLYFYVMDIPFGSKRIQSCNQCGYNRENE